MIYIVHLVMSKIFIIPKMSGYSDVAHSVPTGVVGTIHSVVHSVVAPTGGP